MLALFVLTLLVYPSSSQVELVREKEVVGIQGIHYNIPCNIGTTGNVEYIRWADLVNNVDRDPIEIYDSRGNPSFGINEDHPKKINFMVREDYTLEIVFLEVLDYGEYICEVKKVNDSTIYQEKFQLSVLQQPKCDPGKTVTEGQTAEFTCSMEYGAFSLPTMDWHDGKMNALSSMDNTEIGKFVKKVSFTAEPRMNGEKFTCKAGIQETMQTCTVKMEVEYAVQGVEVSPMKDAYMAGDKILCTASGNPQPVVVWKMKDTSGAKELQKGQEKAELEIKDSWVGTEVSLWCSASNKVRDNVSIINKTIPIFQVLERPPTPKPTEAIDTEASTTGGVGMSSVIGGLVAAAIVLIIIIAIVYIVKKRNSKKAQGAKPVPTKDPEENHKDDMKA